MRKLSAAVLAGVLLLTVSACGQGGDPASSTAASSSTSAPATSGSSTAASIDPQATATGEGKFADVTVEVSDDSKTAPKVTVPTALADAKESSAREVKAGTGAALEEGQSLTLNVGYYNSGDGSAIAGADYTKATEVALTEANFAGLGESYELLKKAKVGTTLAVYVPTTVTQNGGRIMAMHVAAATNPPKKASAAEVAKLKAAGALPTATFAADGKPTITIPKGKDAPSDLIVEVLKEGTGKAATAKSTVTAKYLGVNWSKGEKFDSSYDRTPDTSEFPLTGVISGWTQGLTGVKQGSTVLLTIPRAMAYPSAAEGEATYGPLVFVVELTKVS